MRSWAVNLTRAALAITIVLVIVRATTAETLRDPTEVMPGGTPAPRGMGVVGSVVLDTLMCLPAILVLLRAAVDRTFTVRFSLAHGMTFALCTWIILSVLWASDRYSAAIQATHWAGAMVLLWSTSQLIRDWKQLRLIGGVCLGVLLVLAVRGLEYHFLDVPDIRTNFQQHEREIFAQRGWTPDSFIAQQFKRKVLAGELIGFSASPNTYAMELVLLGIIAAGMAVQRMADRDAWGWSAGIGACLVSALLMLWMTGCRAALVTPIFAIGIFIVGILLRLGAIHRRLTRRTIYWAIIAVIAGGVLMIISYGRSHGSLVHDSLTFRWRYWVGAMRIVSQHVLRGVGFGNFGNFYLAVRMPVASEEIKDPHNFFVRILVETGIVGAALLLAWLLRMAWEATAPTRAVVTVPSADDAKSPIKTLFLLAAGAMAINVLIGVDLSQSMSYVTIEVLKRVVWAGAILLGLIVGWFRSGGEQVADPRPAVLIRLAIIASLAAFLLHNTIEFGMFESGPLGLFALLCGSLLGQSSAAAERNGNWIAAGLAAVGLGGAAFAWTVPVVQAEATVAAADDELLANRADSAAIMYECAATALPIADGQLFLMAANAEMYSAAPPAQVIALIDAATASDPTMIRGWLVRAEYEYRTNPQNVELIRRDYERAIALNPNDVDVRTDYGKVLERLGVPADAARAYEGALAANDGLAGDEPKRLSAGQVAAMRERIKALRGE